MPRTSATPSGLPSSSSKYEQAAGLADPKSAATRYLAHQAALDRAYQLNDQNSDRSNVDTEIEPNEGTGSIRIKSADGHEYVWKDFTFNSGKITAWTSPSGPIGSVLWTRKSRSSALGVTGRLVSAYRTNSGVMSMVVEFATTRDVDLGTASFAEKGGYRQGSSNQSWLVGFLAKGEKTLNFYYFDGANFGGTLWVKIASTSGDKTANLALPIN